MSAPENLTSTHQSILQAWESAFAQTRVTYLSGPITTGPRHLERLQSKSNSLTKADVIRENCIEIKATAARLRLLRGEVIVEPASLEIANWTQRDYLLLWENFIERHAKLIIFMEGWEYSVGCVQEFVRATRNDIRTEAVSGSRITTADAIAALDGVHNYLKNFDGQSRQELENLSARIAHARDQLRGMQAPQLQHNAGSMRKDASLDVLADKMNVAQFVSFAPSASGPKQQYARIAGEPPNKNYRSQYEAVEKLLRSSSDCSVNVRSYHPNSPQSREFIYGLKSVQDVVSAIERLTDEGLHTIVNETIDIHDGGVSGVLMGDILEFAPDDTPRCVEKPGTASMPRGWGRELLSNVYGFDVQLDVPLASRLEFSIHPRPRGWRQTNVLAWEFSPEPYVQAKPAVSWPNRFSRLVGDKTFGLLVAHYSGFAVPFTTVISRRIAPFSFGQRTHSGEKWIRTAPTEQVPGKFKTNHGWLDPFELIINEDIEGKSLSSVLAQDGVRQAYSGALIVGPKGQIIVEGKRGEGETLMLGISAPEHLPASIEADVKELYRRAEEVLGPVRFEWVHDGNKVWVVQLHAGATSTTAEYITNKTATRWETFDVSLGLEMLRGAISNLPPDTGIVLSGRVGLTSHFADVIRRADVPARMGTFSL